MYVTLNFTSFHRTMNMTNLLRDNDILKMIKHWKGNYAQIYIYVVF